MESARVKDDNWVVSVFNEILEFDIETARLAASKTKNPKKIARSKARIQFNLVEFEKKKRPFRLARGGYLNSNSRFIVFGNHRFEILGHAVYQDRKVNGRFKTYRCFGYYSYKARPILNPWPDKYPNGFPSIRCRPVSPDGFCKMIRWPDANVLSDSFKKYLSIYTGRRKNAFYPVRVYSGIDKPPIDPNFTAGTIHRLNRVGCDSHGFPNQDRQRLLGKTSINQFINRFLADINRQNGEFYDKAAPNYLDVISFQLNHFYSRAENFGRVLPELRDYYRLNINSWVFPFETPVSTARAGKSIHFFVSERFSIYIPFTIGLGNDWNLSSEEREQVSAGKVMVFDRHRCLTGSIPFEKLNISYGCRQALLAWAKREANAIPQKDISGLRAISFHVPKIDESRHRLYNELKQRLDDNLKAYEKKLLEDVEPDVPNIAKRIFAELLCYDYVMHLIYKRTPVAKRQGFTEKYFLSALGDSYYSKNDFYRKNKFLQFDAEYKYDTNKKTNEDLTKLLPIRYGSHSIWFRFGSGITISWSATIGEKRFTSTFNITEAELPHKLCKDMSQWANYARKNEARLTGSSTTSARPTYRKPKEYPSARARRLQEQKVQSEEAYRERRAEAERLQWERQHELVESGYDDPLARGRR